MVAALFVFGVDSNLVWCYTFIYIIKLGAERLKKKREKPEDFIGWKSPDGKLEVIGIAGKTKRGATLFKVICTECSKDKELFPDGCFVSIKGHLKSDQKPCGCASNPKWKDWHYLILARRAGKDRFIVHGFAEEFKNSNTKLRLECLKDGHKWTASINNVINSSRGCPKCSNKYKPTEQEALQKCIDICKEMEYNVIGFVDGYKSKRSRFEYICKIHGKQTVSYDNFVNGGTRCGGCWKDRQKELGNLYGYYPERKDETDFLYVLDFDGKFIKVGRSFDVDERISDIKKPSRSGVKNIKILSVYTAKHGIIYPTEQEIHDELRERGFEFRYDHWNSNELFQAESMFILQKLLDMSGLERVQ